MSTPLPSPLPIKPSEAARPDPVVLREVLAANRQRLIGIAESIQMAIEADRNRVNARSASNAP